MGLIYEGKNEMIIEIYDLMDVCISRTSAAKCAGVRNDVMVRYNVQYASNIK